MNASEKLIVDDLADKATESVYRSLVGGLIYLTYTDPDLSNAVSMVLRFMQDPLKLHLGAAKSILKYIAGTTHFGICWSSKKQTTMALSSTEAKYINATAATCQAILLRGYLIIWELKHHFTRDMVAQELVTLEHCSTNNQLAYILTKALTREKFVYFRHQLGVMEFESRGGVEK
ncbi:secreted RxLR effector protein 161-like [Bidens hawaiensis]|uniref:secreted RxLR effector protein 161-like n=1 Tax=Bidens hawaiensis TaxID=980011 RepID=UPI00404932E3